MSGLLFQDCIVLISSTTAGLKKLFKLVKKHCDHLLLGINNGEGKFKVISPGDELWEIIDDQGIVDLSLRQVIKYSYLGLETSSSIIRSNMNKQAKSPRTAKKTHVCLPSYR